MPIKKYYYKKAQATRIAEQFTERTRDTFRANQPPLELQTVRCIDSIGTPVPPEIWNLYISGEPTAIHSYHPDTDEPVYIPAIRCRVHPMYVSRLDRLITRDNTSIFTSTHSYNEAICIHCYFTCRFCGITVAYNQSLPSGERGENNPVRLCYRCARDYTYCEIHDFYSCISRGEHCGLCVEENESWRKISVTDNDVAETKKLAHDSIKRKNQKSAKEMTYRPMCRRTRDYRILEIIDRVGKLPVQICLIGGGDDFMDCEDIVVSNDLRLPDHPLTRRVTINPSMTRTMPYTIALSRRIRKSNAELERVIDWIKAFK